MGKVLLGTALDLDQHRKRFQKAKLKAILLCYFRIADKSGTRSEIFGEATDACFPEGFQKPVPGFGIFIMHRAGVLV